MWLRFLEISFTRKKVASFKSSGVGEAGELGEGKMHVSFQAANIQRSDKECRININLGVS